MCKLDNILPNQILDVSFAHEDQVNTGKVSSMIPCAEEHNHNTHFSGVVDAHGERGYTNPPYYTATTNITYFALLGRRGSLFHLMSHFAIDWSGNPQLDFYATALRCHYGSRAGHLHW